MSHSRDTRIVEAGPTDPRVAGLVPDAVRGDHASAQEQTGAHAVAGPTPGEEARAGWSPGEDGVADSTPPVDDLAGELAAHAARPLGRTTLGLAGAVLVVAGFIAGVLVQKAATPAGSAGNGRGALADGAFPSGLGGFSQGGAAGRGNAGSGGSAGATRSGTVTLVDGTTLYLTTAAGETVTVRTTGATAVTSSQAATLASLKPGTEVTVAGSVGTDGVVTATRVTASK